MSNYETLLLEYTHNRRVVTVTMNRPDMHNALNTRLLVDLKTVFEELGRDETLSGVILTGAGRSFSAGADLAMMRDAVHASREQNQEEALRLAATFESIDACPLAVIARVNGAALGGGLGLLAVSDIVIAVESARLAFSEVKLGIAPAVISPYVVRKIGTSWARRLFVTGERFSPALAREIGLVHTVVTPEELDAAVERVIQELLSSGPQAIRACKALARDIGELDAETARGVTTETIARLRVSAEGQEGLRAYLEKRQPAWITTTPSQGNDHV